MHLPKVGAAPLALTGSSRPFLNLASKGTGAPSMEENEPAT
jgi:hypothetical protein